MSESVLSCVEIAPDTTATHSVIWLHGLGADGEDFVPIVPHLGLDSVPVRFVFPNAPRIPVTINAGFVMPAWYDIVDLTKNHDEAGIRASMVHLERLIAREVERGVATENIVVAGFSQGGAIALCTGIRYPRPLAGILALSSYLLLEESLPNERSEANRGIPIFQAHGRFDPMVPFDRGEWTRDRLIAHGYAPEFHEYPMQHEVCLEEIAAIGGWLRDRLGATS